MNSNAIEQTNKSIFTDQEKKQIFFKKYDLFIL